MNPYFPHVFTPIQVGTMRLKNRIFISPYVSGHAGTLSGEITPALVRFLGAEAKSGAALVTIGSTPIERRRGFDYYGDADMTDDAYIADMRLLAAEVHRYGAKISVEMNHAGRAAFPALRDGPAYAPSLLPTDDPTQVKEIELHEMARVIEDYKAFVRRCVAARFDMVTIHMAHGNLMSSFLSPAYNHRTDEYGGTPERRMRFPLEVVKACREAAGNRINLEIRICGCEWEPGCPELKDTIAFLQKAQEYVDMVNISGGMITTMEYMRYSQPSYYMPHKINLAEAAEIKKALKIPVAVVGGFTCIEECEETLREGLVDAVLIAKASIADMDIVTKAMRGKASEIRPCLRCYHCCDGPSVGGELRCSVNPVAGRETRYAEIYPSPNPRTVMVVGGGPAGMMAAQTLRKRGHTVALYEAGDRLGGRLYEASALYCKDTSRKYIQWDIDETERSGATIHLNTRVTPELIRKKNPDVLILAVGGREILPPIPGIDGENVITVVDADLKRRPVGQRVVICGGGLSGSECAIELAHEGRQVTLVEMKPQSECCLDCSDLITVSVFDFFREYGVQTRYECTVTEITPDGVVITGKDGVRELLKADTVIAAFGIRPDTAQLDQLSEIVPETYVAGDANVPGNIYSANTDGFNIAVEL